MQPDGSYMSKDIIDHCGSMHGIVVLYSERHPVRNVMLGGAAEEPSADDTSMKKKAAVAHGISLHVTPDATTYTLPPDAEVYRIDIYADYTQVSSLFTRDSVRKDGVWEK